jgi:hypothetical protein
MVPCPLTLFTLSSLSPLPQSFHFPLVIIRAERETNEITTTYTLQL